METELIRLAKDVAEVAKSQSKTIDLQREMNDIIGRRALDAEALAQKYREAAVILSFFLEDVARDSYEVLDALKLIGRG